MRKLVAVWFEALAFSSALQVLARVVINKVSCAVARPASIDCGNDLNGEPF